MEVAKNIAKCLNGYIFGYCKKISEQHSIPLEDLLKIWCEQQNVCFKTEFSHLLKHDKKQVKLEDIKDDTSIEDAMSTLSLTDVDATEIREEEKAPPAKPTKAETSPKGVKCEYVFSRGAKKGQRCTTICKTGPLCSKHK